LRTTLICGQILEGLLKSFLSLKMTEKEVRKPLHEIAALWEAAYRLGLAIPGQMPKWAQDLNHTHAKPLRARYPTEDVLAHPVSDDATQGLLELEKIVIAAR
jgi:hypothetical protein